MTEEEIKKLKDLAVIDLNKDYLEDLAQFDKDYSEYVYHDTHFDDVKEEYEDDIWAQGEAYDEIGIYEENAAATAKSIQKKYGESISRQITTFFAGPQDASDEKVSQWVKDNYRIVRLLACSRMPEALKKIDNSSILFALCSFAEKMPAVVSIAKNFMLKYHKEVVADYDKQPQPEEKEYQRSMEKNVEDLKSQRANLTAKDKNILKGTTMFLSESGNFYNDNRKKFDKFAENLEKAKTFSNSKEYENLIKCVKHMNSSENYIVKGDAYNTKRTDLHNYSMKLFSIKQEIDRYLNHKAKDGVKKNTFEKLAAVEELNSFVSQELEKYKPDFNERETAHGNVKKVKCTYAAWHETFKQVPEAVEMPDKQRDALNCMGRIIAKAEKQQLPKGKVKDLETMYKNFGGTGVEKNPEVKEDTDAKVQQF